MRFITAMVMVVGVLATPALAFESKLGRHAGRVQSLIPDQAVLVLEESRAGGAVETLEVDVRNAQVVKVRRDPADPWRWVEEPVPPQKLSAGTWVVVIGRATRSGAIQAARIEVPNIE